MLYRGTARKELQDFAAAAEDFESALRYEPTNKQALEDRKACLQLLYAQTPDLKPIQGHTESISVTVNGAAVAGVGEISGAPLEEEENFIKAASSRRLAEDGSQVGREAKHAQQQGTVKAIVQVAREDEGDLPPLPVSIPQNADSAEASLPLSAPPEMTAVAAADASNDMCIDTGELRAVSAESTPIELKSKEKMEELPQPPGIVAAAGAEPSSVASEAPVIAQRAFKLINSSVTMKPPRSGKRGFYVSAAIRIECSAI